MMKYLTYALLVTGYLLSLGQLSAQNSPQKSDTLFYFTDLELAKAEALKSDKPLFVYMTKERHYDHHVYIPPTWKAISESASLVQLLNEDFIFVKLDYVSNKEQSLEAMWMVRKNTGCVKLPVMGTTNVASREKYTVSTDAQNSAFILEMLRKTQEKWRLSITK